MKNQKYYACVLMLDNCQRGDIVNALRRAAPNMINKEGTDTYNQLAYKIDAAGCGWLKDDLKTLILESEVKS